MICPGKGMIQAYIDDELNSEEKCELKKHLSECKECTKLYEELSCNEAFACEKIELYKNEYANDMDKVVRPFSYSNPDIINNLLKGVSSFMRRYKKVAAMTCVALIAVMCVTVQPIRAAVSDFLSIFRVDNVKGITVTLDDIRQIQDQIKSHSSEIDMDKLGKIKIDGGDKKWISYDDARNITDFKVLFPQAADSRNFGINTVDPESMQFTLNIGSVNEALKSFGAQELLPESLDGKTFMVSIPRQVNLQYNEDGEYYNIIEAKVPEIDAQDGVNADDIYNCLTDLPIIPDDLHRQLESIKDWKTTMYIPVVESKMEEIDINGSKGYVGSLDGLNGKNSSSLKTAVIWYKDGVFYGVESNTSRDDLISFAQSMR